MKFLFDFVPVLLFFAVFHAYGIYVATITGIVATALQVIIYYMWKRAFDKQQLLTLAVFVLFGGLTLYFHNPIFVKWKPTIVFWIMALVFLGSQYIGRKPLLQRMLEGNLGDQSLSLTVWRNLTRMWIVFFTLLGAINIIVAYYFSTNAWVSFKFYGITGLLLLFCVVQAVYLARHLKD